MDLAGCHIPEMDTVIATVTGYTGVERSNLIKLINSSGAFFVGSLRKSITHVVCWKFEGEKYELAKKWGTIIINHRWFEDCIKAGKRISEGPYTSLSGMAAGTLLWREPKLEAFNPTKNDIEINSGHVNNGVADSLSKQAESSSSKSREKSKKTEKLKFPVQNRTDCNLESIDQSLVSKEKMLASTTSKQAGQKLERSSSILNEWVLKIRSPKKTVLLPRYRPNKKVKLPASRKKTSCSILDYVSLLEDIEAPEYGGRSCLSQDPNFGSSAIISIAGDTQEEIEDCVELAPTLKHGKKTQLSLSRYDVMRQRKRCRLMKRSDSGTDLKWDDEDNETAECQLRVCTGSAQCLEKGEDNETASQVPRCASGQILHSDKSLTNPVASLPHYDIACVICHTEKILSSEGILTCGHRFCFPCIRKWASESTSKLPTCPLCKASFDIITKREKVIGLANIEDCSQSSASQYEESLVTLNCAEQCDQEHMAENINSATCVMCGIGDMDELLLNCNGCGRRSAHTFCLDPPLPPVPHTPWFCGRCTQRRRVDTSWWYQLHAFGRRLD